jgi:hypothetical protein
MTKNLFNADLGKSISAMRDVAQTVLENTQELAHINYQITQDLAAIAQAKAARLMKVQDPKAAIDLLQGESIEELLAQMKEYQEKILRVFQRGNQELVHAVDEAIDQSLDDLKDLVSAMNSNSPPGAQAFTSAFTSSFNAGVENINHVRSMAQEAFSSIEKNVESAMSSTQGQFGQSIKKMKTTQKKASAK